VSHTHCLAPSRVSSHRAVPTSTSQARLFPELPSFSADEAFLFALGRAGPLRLRIGR
jgi:hypothetical protein